MEPIDAFACTHIGRRQNNEDAYCISPSLGLYAVADGMGGYQKGEVASQMALETIEAFFQRNAESEEVTWPFALDRKRSFAENLLDVSVRMAHRAVSSHSREMSMSMGTTLAMIACPPKRWSSKPCVMVGHVGDSRVYRLQGERLEQLTSDHSLYEQLRASGAELPPLKDFLHANVITRALGMTGEARPDVSIQSLAPGDRFLLCTDGLTGPLSDDEITEILEVVHPQEACERLVQAAYDAGGKDNITAIVVDFCREGAIQQLPHETSLARDASFCVPG